MYYRHDFIEGAFCNFQPPALTKYFPFSQSLVQTLLAIYLIFFLFVSLRICYCKLFEL